MAFSFEYHHFCYVFLNRQIPDVVTSSLKTSLSSTAKSSEVKGLPPDLLINLEELVTTLCSAKNRDTYHLVVQLLVRRSTIHGHPRLPVIHFFPYPGRLAWSQFTALVDCVCVT